MNEYLKWLDEQIAYESNLVAEMVSAILAAKRKFKKDHFDKSAARHQAFSEAKFKYIEMTGNANASESDQEVLNSNVDSGSHDVE